MARKKQEIALQVEIETQEEWEEMLAKEGLTIVDVYQEWCGPCKALLGFLKRLKNELGDDLLHFAMAKADTVDALDRYRGKCQPCFLFYAGGSLVAVIRGANSPVITKTITEQLAYEHKVLDGNAERKEIRDPLFHDLDEREKGSYDEMETEEEEDVQKEVTVALIKPDIVKAGKVDEVIEQLEAAGIEILAKEERTLTDEEAREFYSHKAEEDYFEDMIKFMTSGPSHVLVLSKGETGENVINEFRDLLGPPSVEEAREIAPDSFRAKYGSEKYVNALHGSDSQETAMRELAFFFPSFAVPTVPGKPKAKPKVQRTLALIRPDALKENKDAILEKIKESGFRVALQKEVQLSREQAVEFYKEHKEEEYFEELIERMTNGKLLALGLAREDAVTGWRDMLGPKEVDKAKEEAPESLRAQFSVEDVPINQLHGSDSEDTAQKELEFFFPMQQTVAAIKPDAYQTKEEIMDKIREAGFRIAARKETELSKDMAEQFYKDVEDKEYYDELVEHMTSGKTLFMVLSREDAVDGWRSLMGPTDPEQAKDANPDSIRAQFGHDVKANAVHGSSNKEHADAAIHQIFGELEFTAEGVLKGDETLDDEMAQTETEEGDLTEHAEGEEGSRPASGKSGKSKEGSRPATAGSQKDDSRPGSRKSRPQTGASQKGGDDEQKDGEKEEGEKEAATEGEEEQKEDGGEDGATEEGDKKESDEQETQESKEDAEQQKPDEKQEGEQETQAVESEQKQDGEDQQQEEQKDEQQKDEGEKEGEGKDDTEQAETETTDKKDDDKTDDDKKDEPAQQEEQKDEAKVEEKKEDEQKVDTEQKAE